MELLSDPPSSRPTGFDVKWASQLAEPIPPTDWICHGYALPRQCYALVAGESYSGKSLWVTDLAIAIAAGRQAVNLYQTTKGRVLWLDFDGQGTRVTQSRLQRMTRAMGVALYDLRDSFGYVWLPKHHLDDDDAVEVFTKRLEGFSFAVIDSWRGAISRTEEKDRAQVQKVGGNILRIIENTGCTIMMVDHTIKPSMQQPSRSAMHDIHGSSAKSELVQWGMTFRRQQGTPTQALHFKERAEARTMEPFWLRYEDVAFEDDPRWGLRVVHLSKEQLEFREDNISALKAKIVRALSEAKYPHKAQEIQARVGGSINAVKLALRELISAGEVEKDAAEAFVMSTPF